MVPTRTLIECTYGIWKGRWLVLKQGLRHSPEKACKIIMATAVCHNLIYEFGENPEIVEDIDVYLPTGLESEAETECEQYDEESAVKRSKKDRILFEQGKKYRNRIAQMYFAN